MLDKLDSEDSLMNFTKNMWPVLEPGREMKTGWALEAICEHLEYVSRGDIIRLLINVPPGCMKSLLTNVFWLAWEWGPKNLPSNRFISSSYSEILSIRDNRKARILMANEAYQTLWGDRFKIVSDQNAKEKFENDKTGFSLATSVAGVGTGERSDRFRVDDPHNVRETESDPKRESALQWFAEVVPTRINDPEKSAIVVIMQRIHERDVSGLILEQALEYTHLMIPMEFEEDRRCTTMIWLPEGGKKEFWTDPRTEEGELMWAARFSKKHLERELKPQLSSWGGDYAIAGQLQQAPVPRGGGLFKESEFIFVDERPKKVVKRVRGWDLAGSKKKTSPYTVGLLMSIDGDGVVYIEHIKRGRWIAHDVDLQLIDACKVDGRQVIQDIPQDPGQAGKAQKSHIARKLQGQSFRFSPESGDKELRAQPLASQASGGNLRLVKGPWNKDFVTEACKFPKGRYKDQIDAASRAYAGLLRGGHEAPPVGGEIITEEQAWEVDDALYIPEDLSLYGGVVY